MAKKSFEVTMPDAELADRLSERLAKISHEMGWDHPRAWSDNKKRGYVRVQHVGVQGSYELAAYDAEPYLNWLIAGGKGSFLKFKKAEGKI